MKKYLTILTVMLIVVIIVLTRGNTEASENDEVSINGNGSNDICDICLNDLGKYDIEVDAKVIIGVDNTIVGDKLISLWNEMNTESSGLLSYIVFNTYNSVTDPDVYLIDELELQVDEYYSLDEELLTNNNFMKYSFDGAVFSYNQTMLESFGIDMIDSDGDFLPDAIDTWEKIFNLSIVGESYKGNVINEIYPISINEAWTAYSSLTAGGYVYNENGFESIEFLEGLEFIEDFSKLELNNDTYGMKLEGNRMGYRLDEYLTEEAYPFALVGSWSDVESFESMKGIDLRFSQMPTFKGNTLSPFTKVRGFVINKDVAYPSAAHEILRWLTETETIKVMMNFSNIIPTPNLMYISANENTIEMMNAFMFSHVETSSKITGTSVNFLDAYYNSSIGEYLVDLWNGDKTALETQQEIVVLSEAWIANQE